MQYSGILCVDVWAWEMIKLYIYIYLESYVYSSSVLYILQINFSFFAFYYKNICPPIIDL